MDERVAKRSDLEMIVVDVVDLNGLKRVGKKILAFEVFLSEE